jgi:hypothetical protein
LQLRGRGLDQVTACAVGQLLVRLMRHPYAWIRALERSCGFPSANASFARVVFSVLMTR